MAGKSNVVPIDPILDEERLAREAVEQANKPFGNPLYCVCKAFLCQVHFAAPHGRISALKCPDCKRVNDFRCTADGIQRVVR